MPSKVKMIGIAGMAVVGLGVGSKVFLGAAPAAAGDPGAPATTTTTAPGPIEALEPITVNLVDGHYLKVGLALQLAPGEIVEEEGDPTTTWAKGLDLAIEVLGGRRYDELVTPEGREAAKAALEAGLRKLYPEVVEGVYFTELVLQ